MEFSLAWLADHVDLSAELPLATGAAGRRVLERIDDEVRAAVRRLGDRLTAAGFAVEGLREIRYREDDFDLVLDVDVTSNRPDAMCHRGLARELAVSVDRPLTAVEPAHFGTLSSSGRSGPVQLEDPEGCPRYVARILRGVRIGPSPEWIQRRLRAIGLRPINNVVDATNFILWDDGQPLHAFDLATLPGAEIRVRRAREGERLTTLDGVDRLLDPEILVIADRQRAVALAGIMGGLDTEVTERTTDILLESAHFDRRRVRIGARALGMHTDASHRFERGADPGICDAASRHCAALLVEVAGGTVLDGAVDARAARPSAVRWELSGAALDRFAGCAIADAESQQILSGLGFAPRPTGERLLAGTVPSWREADFEPRRSGEDAGKSAYAQDLYEEVLRHVGLDRIPSTLPSIGGVDSGVNRSHELAGRVRRLLAAVGFAEAIHFAFHERAADDRLPRLGSIGEPLALANPLSERFAVLRRSLVPNLVAAAEFNANRGAGQVALFEVGHLFPAREAPELAAVAFVLGGLAAAPWQRRAEPDLFAAKGVCEVLFEELAVPATACRPEPLTGIVETTGALFLDPDGAAVGWLGQIEGCDTPYPLFAAEILLDRLRPAALVRTVEPPPRLPGIEADLTLTHDLAVTWTELAAAIDRTALPILAGYHLKDRYRGKGVPAHAVATTIRFDYHGGDRSLTQEEVNERHSALAAELEGRFGIAREEKR